MVVTVDAKLIFMEVFLYVKLKVVGVFGLSSSDFSVLSLVKLNFPVSSANVFGFSVVIIDVTENSKILYVVKVEAFVVIAVCDPSYVGVIFVKVLFENVNLLVVVFGNIEVNVIMEDDCWVFKVAVRDMKLFREVDVFCLVDFILEKVDNVIIVVSS